MMLRLRRLAAITPSTARNILKGEENPFRVIPLQNPSLWVSNRHFLDIYQFINKAAVDKRRARIFDEMSRGYFQDMADMKEHGGKIAEANKTLIPAMTAVKFPTIEVNLLDGSKLKLPVTSDGNDAKSDIPKVSLLCLSFRGSSAPMVDSWSLPFLNTFSDSSQIQVYKVSFIDKWLLQRGPIKKLLLKYIAKQNPEDRQRVLQKRDAYHFGDHYYFRKDLSIINLLSGYIFLLDKFGRIRWQGFGSATEDELSSLMLCTSLLLEDKGDS